MLSFPSIFKRPIGGAPDAARDGRAAVTLRSRGHAAADPPGPTRQWHRRRPSRVILIRAGDATAPGSMPEHEPFMGSE